MDEELKTKEYEMLRQEIMQYLEEYQSVRNMMYVVTVTILGFCLSKEEVNVYLYLLPLVVVIPSYLVAFDYWRDVVIDATYIIVFHESKENFPIKWETRHKEYRKNFMTIHKVNFQVIPYYVCAGVCLILYFVNLEANNIMQIILGIMILTAILLVFAIWGRVKYETYIKKWNELKLKQNE